MKQMKKEFSDLASNGHVAKKRLFRNPFIRMFEKISFRRTPALGQIKQLEQEARKWLDGGHSYKSAMCLIEAAKKVDEALTEKKRQRLLDHKERLIRTAMGLLENEMARPDLVLDRAVHHPDNLHAISECYSMLKQNGNSDRQKSLAQKIESSQFEKEIQLVSLRRQILEELYGEKGLLAALRHAEEMARLAEKCLVAPGKFNSEAYNRALDWTEATLYRFANSEEGKKLGLSDEQFEKEIKKHMPSLMHTAHEKKIDEIHQLCARSTDIAEVRERIGEGVESSVKMGKHALVESLERVLLYREIMHELGSGELMKGIEIAHATIASAGRDENIENMKVMLREEFFGFAYSKISHEAGFDPEGVRAALRSLIPEIFLKDANNAEDMYYDAARSIENARKRQQIMNAVDLSKNTFMAAFFSDDDVFIKIRDDLRERIKNVYGAIPEYLSRFKKGVPSLFDGEQKAPEQ